MNLRHYHGDRPLAYFWFHSARNYHGDRPLAPFWFYSHVATSAPRLSWWRKLLRRRRIALKSQISDL